MVTHREWYSQHIYIYARPPPKIYFWCSSGDVHGQTQCTLQLSVQWVHQAWSNSLHTSVKFAVTLLTWNFVSRCGHMFLEYRSACVYGNIRLWCKELVWEEMHFKWNDQLYMLHAKAGSCWKDPTRHVHMEFDSFDASKQREDRNLLQAELARIHTADMQPVLPHCRSCYFAMNHLTNEPVAVQRSWPRSQYSYWTERNWMRNKRLPTLACWLIFNRSFR